MLRIASALVAFLSLLGPQSFAGISTNGSSFSVDQDNVWFLNQDQVDYCIEQPPDFPLSKTEVREAIEESFDAWAAFFRKYGLDQMVFANHRDGQSLKMTTKFVYKPTCSSRNVLLNFKLGYEDAEIRDALSFQDSALAMTVRPAYDHKTFINSGTIWFRKWAYRSKIEFKHVALHEIGHIFGMEHNSLHIMDENIANRLNSVVNAAIGLGEIESNTWRYRLQEGDVVDFTFNSRTGGDSNSFLGVLRSVIGFSQNHKHTLRLRVENSNMIVKGARLVLEIAEQESGKIEKLEGVFMASQQTSNTVKGLMGPTLYTSWYCGGCPNGSSFWRKHLDARPSINEAEGSFVYKGKVYPAVLEQRKGLLLRVFIPEKNLWWSTEHHSGTYYL